MKIAWLTDIHLDFPSPRTLVKFMRALKLSPADVIVISGDIASGPSVEHFLTEIGQKTARTLYFVLGNHDFYGSSFKTVRERVRLLTLSQPGLVWLSEKGVISLTGTTALIGHEGWADGRLGDYERSEVVLNDYLHIMEFQPSGFTGGTALRPKSERLLIMQRLADEAAAHFEKYLEEALQSHRAVLAITHVPPFEQASRYRGELCDSGFLPHYSCKAVGDVMLEKMKKYPDKKLTVLCGHTHSAGKIKILPNLEVLSGRADYYEPRIQQIIEIT